jgi:UMF1 family MFS transporter
VTAVAADLPKNVASQRFYLSTSIAVTIVAILAPFLGAVADYGALKKRLCAVFIAIGVVATCALWHVHRGDWELAVLLFVLGNIGVTGSLVFSESLLPHVARPHEVDRVCTSAFSLGYLSGGLLFALNIWWISDPQAWGIPDKETATRLGFLSAGVWWAVFSLPLFLLVPEPRAHLLPGERAGEPALLVGLRRMRSLLSEVRHHRDLFLLLLAFMIYNDGVVTIIRLATAYGTEVGIGGPELMKAVLLVQLVGVPASLGFGALAARLGPRPSIFVALGVYVVISILGYHMRTATHFFLLALLVATVQGGVQALSRSLFSRLVPRHKSSEFFGFFGVFEKFAGIAGPLLFTGAVAASGSSRGAILGLTVFFVVGGLLLSRVDVERGVRAVAEAEAAAGARPT